MKKLLLLLSLSLAMTPSAGFGEVLGPCGTEDAQKPVATVSAAPQQVAAQPVQRILLPGEKAPNFSLSAIIGNEVKKFKLSDSDGKWRVVCFYPADFTFV